MVAGRCCSLRVSGTGTMWWAWLLMLAGEEYAQSSVMLANGWAVPRHAVACTACAWQETAAHALMGWTWTCRVWYWDAAMSQPVSRKNARTAYNHAVTLAGWHTPCKAGLAPFVSPCCDNPQTPPEMHGPVSHAELVPGCHSEPLHAAAGFSASCSACSCATSWQCACSAAWQP